MPRIGDTNFNHNRRELYTEAPLEQPQGGRTEIVPPDPTKQLVEIQQEVPDKSIEFIKLLLDRILPGQNLQSADFVSGVSGWIIRGDGSAEFNGGGLSVSELHIPDEDTTANSMHVDSDGNTWWGCTATDFAADNDNALAYILKTGVAKFQSTTVNGRTLQNDPVFGDGSDGDVTIAAGTTTLTADKFYDTLVVEGTLNPAGFRIFARTKIWVKNGGAITRSGGDGGAGGAGGAGANAGGSKAGGTAGTAGTAGAAPATKSIYGGLAGKAGKAGGAGGAGGGGSGSSGENATAGDAGESQTVALGADGVAGKNGQVGGPGAVGGIFGSPGRGGGAAGIGRSGGAAGTKTAAISSVRNVASACLMLDIGASPIVQYRGGAGSGGASSGSGGGGGGEAPGAGTDGAGGGGGGGSGGGGATGGLLLVASPLIQIDTGGSILAQGGNGGDGGDGGAGGNAAYSLAHGFGGAGGGGGGGGGGSGGAGGILTLIYTDLIEEGTVSVAGGSGGAGGSAGAAGSNQAGGYTGYTAGDGTAGQAGNAGSAGVRIDLILK